MFNSLRQYRGTLYLHFEKRGENFTLNVPHKPVWDSVIRFLKKRGWTIGINQSYKEHFKVLSKYHKIGFKGEVALLMEINHDSINIQFGNKKNLWTGIAQSFWEKDQSYDKRYTPLTYLEEKAVEIEIFKAKNFCSKWCKPEKTDDERSAVEYILHKESVNKHIHGGAKSLEEIAQYMEKKYQDDYQSKYNLVDKNKKLIYCGEIKHFVDYETKRVLKGIVYHNINNMWWVLLPANVKRNIACFDLFDWDPRFAKKRVFANNHQVKVLTEITEIALKNRDFQKVSKISLVISKLGKEASNV